MVSLSDIEYETMKCEIQNLKEENKRLKDLYEYFRDTPRKIIVQFWMWYVSGNHKRDLSAKEEGEKYANNFFHDLIQEAEQFLNIEVDK